jgi:hypothetical protein
MRHTRDYWTGRPVSYFALHRKGFFMPSRSRATRWALTPPFHPYPDRARLAASRTGRYILCDTIRHYALKRSARTWLPLVRHPARWCPDFPLQTLAGAALPAPWDQRTRSDCQAPKLGFQINQTSALVASREFIIVSFTSGRRINIRRDL